MAESHRGERNWAESAFASLSVTLGINASSCREVKQFSISDGDEDEQWSSKWGVFDKCMCVSIWLSDGCTVHNLFNDSLVLQWFGTITWASVLSIDTVNMNLVSWRRGTESTIHPLVGWKLFSLQVQHLPQLLHHDMNYLSSLALPFLPRAKGLYTWSAESTVQRQ